MSNDNLVLSNFINLHHDNLYIIETKPNTLNIDDSLIKYSKDVFKVLSKVSINNVTTYIARLISTHQNEHLKPKNVYINEDGYYPQCPSCGYFDLPINVGSCPVCDQKLIWNFNKEN